MSDFYKEECEPPVRVYVGNEEIPVVNQGVETQCRVDGPMDINRISDVYFPIEWMGEDIGSKIDAYDPGEDDSNVWQPVDIKLYDKTIGDYRVYHRGFSMAYGAGSTGTLERKLRVGDPAMLLNNMPFSESFGRKSSIGDILSELISEFNGHQDVFQVTEVAHIEQQAMRSLEDISESQDGILGAFTTFPAVAGQGLLDTFTSSGEKQFKSNKHTLQDAMDFVTSKLDGELYFEANEGGYNHLSLVYDENRNRDLIAKNATSEYYGNAPVVIKNNSLYEIQPINSVEVKGQAGSGTLDNIADFVTGDSGEYPVATARHQRLYELAGSEYKPPSKPVEVTSESEAEDKAREKLIKAIEGGGMGEIQLELYPLVTPHDTITTKPACGHNVAQEVSPITYSVEEVTHRVGFDDSGDRFLKRTNLRVNTAVTSADIEIANSGTETL